MVVLKEIGAELAARAGKGVQVVEIEVVRKGFDNSVETAD